MDTLRRMHWETEMRCIFLKHQARLTPLTYFGDSYRSPCLLIPLDIVAIGVDTIPIAYKDSNLPMYSIRIFDLSKKSQGHWRFGWNLVFYGNLFTWMCVQKLALLGAADCSQCIIIYFLAKDKRTNERTNEHTSCRIHNSAETVYNDLNAWVTSWISFQNVRKNCYQNLQKVTCLQIFLPINSQLLFSER